MNCHALCFALVSFYLVPNTNYLLPTKAFRKKDKISVCRQRMLIWARFEGWMPLLANNLPTPRLGLKTGAGKSVFAEVVA